MSVSAAGLARRLDGLLGVGTHPDYPNALNGLQVDHRGPVRKIGAAVDVSQRVVELAVAASANFLIVHHGLFWSGPQRLVGGALARYRLLIEHDVAVYAAHLPLDSHHEYGNNVLLARLLGLEPTRPFASFQDVPVGVAGDSDVPTEVLLNAADALARRHGGSARVTALDPERRTRRWGICTGAGASSDTLREAESAGIDTLIVGEGPHHTAVEAPERGLVVIYAGHYATETLGVAAVAARVAEDEELDWEFISAPTGL